MFPGESLARNAKQIGRFISICKARTILDYGSGKGEQYKIKNVPLPGGRVVESILDFWGNPKVQCYDPAYPPFSEPPTNKFDGVICTDVLEHCPEEDVDWILEEMFTFSRKFVFANIACYPAQKILPDGSNAHCTIKSVSWWQEKIISASRKSPSALYFFTLESKVDTEFGKQKTVSNVIATPGAKMINIYGKIKEMLMI